MDPEKLSDADLRNILKGFGVNVGPVTSTTRQVYENKLRKLYSTSSMSTSNEEVVVESVRVLESPKKRQVYDDRETEFSTPRYYIPDGSHLTRRPLNQNRSNLVTPDLKMTKTTKYVSSKSSNAPTSNKKSGCCSYKMLILTFMVVVSLFMLVYYHMEENKITNIV